MKYYIAIIILIILSVVWLSMPKIDDKEMFMPKNTQTPHLPYHSNASTSLPEHNNATIEQAIINYSIDNNINYEKSLEIADCESKMGKYKINWSGSSAKGIFQWTDGTWEYIKAKGSPMDDMENIKQFTKWYPIHPEWWECK